MKLSFKFALAVLAPETLALIMELSALRQGDLKLGKPALEVEASGDECKPLFLDFADELCNFVTTHQELAGASWVSKCANVQIHHNYFWAARGGAVHKASEASRKAYLAIADSLNLRAGKHESSLETVEKLKIVERLLVGANFMH